MSKREMLRDEAVDIMSYLPQGFLDLLVYDWEEYKNEDDEDYYHFLIDRLEECNVDRYLSWAYGASRLVIWLQENPHAIVKIARNSKDIFYNRTEARVFEEARKEGIDYLFANIYMEFFDEFDDLEICYGEFLDCDEGKTEDSLYYYQYHQYLEVEGLEDCDDSNEAFYSSGCYDTDEDSVLAYMESTCPSWKDWSIVERIFCDWNINDIHSANVGWRDDQLCFSDFGGYHN